MLSKPVAKKIVLRDAKGKSIKQFPMPYNVNLMEIAYFAKEIPKTGQKFHRAMTVNIETYKGDVQYTRKLKANWKHFCKDLREFLRQCDPEMQAMMAEG